MNAEIESIPFPIKLWAEIDGERVEIIKDIQLKVGAGYCHRLAIELQGPAMGEWLLRNYVKTGWEPVTSKVANQ